MPNHGVYVSEQATAVSTPVVADSGIPFVVGTAPAHAAASPAKVNVPVVVTSWNEAVEKLGFSYDWKTYTLCEFMYSHFQLFGCQPVVFCNVLDAAKMQEDMAAEEYPVSDHKATIPFEAINDENLTVQNGEAPLEKDADYSVLYDESEGVCVIELLSSGTAYDAEALTISGKKVTPGAVVETDIVAGLQAVEMCMSMVGTIPDLICAPGWSHTTTVAAVMATKAASINGLFQAKALIDMDCGESGVRQYSDAVQAKNDGNFVDENQVLCWPMLTLGGYKFHHSTQLAGLMAQVDTGNGGCPYESPSNKNYQMDGCCLEDGTEVNLTLEQANMLNANGIVTALNFMSSGWTCWGNYTACYPANTDVKDYFIPVSRMFDWVCNTVVRTFWSKLDKPMNRRLIDTILDTCNIWLNGVVGSGYLLGARAEMLDSENPLTDLMAGIIKIHIYMTPPSPAQEIDFILEYDTSYVTSALQA